MLLKGIIDWLAGVKYVPWEEFQFVLSPFQVSHIPPFRLLFRVVLVMSSLDVDGSFILTGNLRGSQSVSILFVDFVQQPFSARLTNRM